MKKIIFFITILIALSFASVICSAETLEDYVNGISTMRSTYETYLSSAYFNNSKSETEISKQSGAFSFRQTDYHLDGRGGLDLDITRIYKSSWSNLYQYSGSLSGSTWLNYYSTEPTFYEERYNLGLGMRFSFPTVEVIKYGSNSKQMYLHTESGDVYRLINDNTIDGEIHYKLEGYELEDITFTEKLSGEYFSSQYGSITDTAKYCLTDRNGTKIYFSDSSGYTSVTTDNPLYKYEGRILRIEDRRYGIDDNTEQKIDFKYSDVQYDNTSSRRRVITRIIDTVGREITINYKYENNVSPTTSGVSIGDLGGKYNVEITLPDESLLVYEKKRLMLRTDVNTYQSSHHEQIKSVIKKASNAPDAESCKLYEYTFERAWFDFDYGISGKKPISSTSDKKWNEWHSICAIRYSNNRAKLLKYEDGTKWLGYKPQYGAQNRPGKMKYRKVVEEKDVALTTNSVLEASKDIFDENVDNVYTEYVKEPVTYSNSEVINCTSYKYTGDPSGYAEYVDSGSTQYSMTYPLISFEDENDVNLFTYESSLSHYKWSRDNTTSSDGEYCLKSPEGSYTGGRTANLLVNLPIDGLISFDYKVTGTNFTVRLHNASKGSAGTILHSANTKDSWKHFSYNLKSGYWSIEFIYNKSEASDNTDFVYLDNVSVNTNYSTVVTDFKGSTTEYFYDGDNKLTSTVQNGDDHNIVINRTYDNNKMPKHIETITTVIENKITKNHPTYSMEDFTYDKYGNLEKYAGPEVKRKVDGYVEAPVSVPHIENKDGSELSIVPGTIVYQYDTDKYHTLKARVTAISANNISETLYTNNEKGETISETHYYKEGNENKISSTKFDYDKYGNVKRKMVYDGDTTVPDNLIFDAEYEYEPIAIGLNFKDGLYLTHEVTKSNTEATGEINKITERSYTYWPNTGLLHIDTQKQRICNEPAISNTYQDITTTYNYDYRYRCKKVEYSDGSSTEYTYHENGYDTSGSEYAIEVSEKKDGISYDSLYTYNIFGLLLKTQTKNDNGIYTIQSQNQYDCFGNLTKKTDGKGNETEYVYNTKNEIKETIIREKEDGQLVERCRTVVNYNNDVRDYEPFSDVKEVVALNDGVCAVKNDGTVWTWGRNIFGQLGYDITDEYQTFPMQVEGLANVTVSKIFTSNDSTWKTCYALTDDGDVWSWGYNHYGQLGIGTSATEISRSTPTKITELSNVKDIFAFESNTFAVYQDGNVTRVKAWGENTDGMLGNGQVGHLSIPCDVKNVSNVTGIFKNNNSFAAIDATGDEWIWGKNYSSTPYNTTVFRNSNIKVKQMTSAFGLFFANVCHSDTADKVHDFYAWGYNETGFNNGLPTQNPSNTWVARSSSNIRNIKTFMHGFIFITDDNKLSYKYRDSLKEEAIDISLPAEIQIKDLVTSDSGFFILTESNEVYKADYVSPDVRYKKINFPENVDIRYIYLHEYSNILIAVDTDGRLYAQRNNSSSGGGRLWKNCNSHPTLVYVQCENTKDFDFIYSVTLTDAEGYKTTNYYDEFDHIVACETSPDRDTTGDHASVYTTKYEYDIAGNVVKITDARNNDTTFEYDELSRLVKKNEPLGKTTTYKYNGLNLLTEKNESDNKTTLYKYNKAGLLESEKVGPTNNIDNEYVYKTYDYDLSGNIKDFRQGYKVNGVETADIESAYYYDNRNRLSDKYTVIDGSNKMHEKFEYNHVGDLVLEKVLDGDNYIQTEYVYDMLRRNILKETTANYEGNNVGTAKVGYVYDNNNNITEKHEYYGAANTEYDKTEYEYDYANRLVKLIEPVGVRDSSTTRTTKFEYDNKGNLTAKMYNMDGSDNFSLTTTCKVTYEYDGLDRVVKQTDAIGRISRYGYDENGNRTDEIISTSLSDTDTDIKQLSRYIYVYDALNQMTNKIEINGSNQKEIEARTYDGRGNLSGVKLGDSVTPNRMTYDASDNMTEYGSAESNGNISKEMTYNSRGQVVNSTVYYSATESYTTEYDYYGTGWLKSIKYPDHTSLEEYEYDNTGRLYEKKTDRTGFVIETFKTLYGDPWKTHYPLTGETETTDYNLYLGLAMVYVDRKKKKYRYNYDIAKNLIEEMHYVKNNSNTENVDDWEKISMTYDKWDNLTSRETFTSERSCDDMGSVELNSISYGDKITYTYNATFDIIGIYEGTAENFTKRQTFEYTDDYAVISRTLINDNEEDVKISQYDSFGRLISETQLIDEIHLDEPDNYTICTGEFEGKRSLSTYYEYEGDKVKKITPPNGTAYSMEYFYNGDGQISQIKKPNNNTVNYYYNYAGQLIKEDVSEGKSTRYTYDALGREKETIVLSDTDSDLVWKKTYDLKGNVASESTPSLENAYTYIYDAFDRLIAKQNANGDYLEIYQYNDVNNTVYKVDAKSGINNENGESNYKFDPQTRTMRKWDYVTEDFVENGPKNEGELITYNASDKIVQRDVYMPGYETYCTKYEYDIKGNLIKETNAKNDSVEYAYNPDGTIACVQYPDGGRVDYEYDKKNRVVKETTKQTSSQNIVTEYQYTATDDVYEIKNHLNSAEVYTTVYKYDGQRNVKTVRDRNGYVTKYNYNLNGLLSKKQVPINETISQTETYEYNKAGMLKIVTKEGGTLDDRVTTNNYTNGWLTSVTNNAGQKTSYTYDDAGNILLTKVLRKNEEAGEIYDITKTEYDDYGRLTSVIQYLDEASVASEYKTAVTDELGVKSQTEYEYDILGNKISAKAPMAFASDVASQAQYITTYAYDKLSRLTCTETTYDGIAVQSSYTYDSVGNRETVEDAKGNVTAYTYDSMGRVKTIKNAKGVIVSSYDYDLAGNKIAETTPNGTWNYTYDSLNRLSETKRPGGEVIEKNIYDGNGNIIKKIDGNGYASASNDTSRYGVEYEYNMANQVESVTYPENEDVSVRYEYNAFGELVLTADQNDQTTAYEYNMAGNLIKVTNALGKSTEYTYDYAGNKISMEDANGQVSTYTYGSFGMLLSAEDPLEQSVKYQYTLTGKPALMEDKNGNITNYEYNSLDLLTATSVLLEGETDVRPENSITYSYDCLGNRTGMQDVSGSYVYSYDVLSQLCTVTKDNEQILHYTYHDDGTVHTKTYGGIVVTYLYDASGRLSSVASGGATANYTYDASNNITEVAYAGGVTETRAYNKNNAVTSVINTNASDVEISHYSYSYDNTGRQISKTDLYGTTGYEYDAAGQLTKVTMPGKTTEYEYDNVGNRTRTEEYGFTDPKTFDKPDETTVEYTKKITTYVYDGNNRLISGEESLQNALEEEVAQLNTIYTYDKNGNQYMVVKNVLTPTSSDSDESELTELNAENVMVSQTINLTVSTFDGFNRLKNISVVKDGSNVITDYVYNGDGLRTEKTVQTAESIKTTNYVYDGSYVVSESGDTTATYVRGLRYIAKIGESNGVSYYMYNAHGDVVQMTGSTGTVKNRYEYDAFGETILENEENGNSIKYAGEFYDASSGLYYLRARYYNPQTGRFISEDSYKGDVKDPASLNLYTYCKNDPVTFIDPTGHSAGTEEYLEKYRGNDYLDGSGSKKSSSGSKGGGSSNSMPTYKVPAIRGPYYDGTPTPTYNIPMSANGTPTYKVPGVKGPYYDGTPYWDTPKPSEQMITMYHSLSGTQKSVARSRVQQYRDNGWLRARDKVTLYSGEDLSGITVSASEIGSYLYDENSAWYTKAMEVGIFDALTGDLMIMTAGEAQEYVQSGSAYVLGQEIPAEVFKRWVLVAGFRNLGIDPFENVVNYNGVPRNYIQLITEDMPYLSALQGAPSSTYNQSTAALQNIFKALGMSTDYNGIFDTWSNRGAVDAIMGDFYDLSKTDGNFYARLQEIIMTAAILDDAGIAELRSGLAGNQNFFKSSLIQGQRNYEEARRREAALRQALKASIRKRAVEQQNTSAVVDINVFNKSVNRGSSIGLVTYIGPIYASYVSSYSNPQPPTETYFKKSFDQFLLGNYTDDVTLLGTTAQVLFGFTGFDFITDIRDLIFDFTHLDCSSDHIGQTVIDVAALFPIVGALKYGDEAGAIIKNVDDIVDGSKRNIQMVSEHYLKQKGINPHQLKQDILGSKAPIAEYDIYTDKNTGELFIYRKKGKGDGIPTGEFIK